MTRLHWALAVAIAIVLAQAAFIGTRLMGNRSSEVQETSRTSSETTDRPASARTPDQVQSAAVSTLGSVKTAASRPEPAPARRAAGPARLVVRSTPPGAEVTVDGRRRGVTPLTLQGVAPGAHKVVVQSPAGAVEHAVTTEPGETATVIASLSPGTSAGWIAVNSPAVLQIFEGSELLGTSATPRLMVTAGRHTFDLVNEELGYRSSQVVDVTAGQVSRVAPDMPLGTVHLNALPWAEVWIDGRKAGDTPIGNLQLPIGPHEVVFRHPDLGEVTRTVVATLRGPARLSVTLKQDRE